MVRRSRRSFSGWVCVCSFRSSAVAVAFSRAAASRFLGFGCFCLVRRAGRRFRVSVPCSRPSSSVLLLRPRFVRVGRFRVRFPAWPSAAAAAAVSALRSPCPVSALLRGCRSVGFSGSRAPSLAAVSALRSVLSCLPPAGVRVAVGCARGVDSAVRGALAGSPSLLCFSASSPRFARAGVRGALALRSAACVRSVAPGRLGLLVCLPSGACPPGVAPGRRFCGRGSGSWGSAALAVGLGRRVAVWLPRGVCPPAWSGFSWSALGGGWWLCRPLPPSVVQLSLF